MSLKMMQTYSSSQRWLFFWSMQLLFHNVFNCSADSRNILTLYIRGESLFPPSHCRFSFLFDKHWAGCLFISGGWTLYLKVRLMKCCWIPISAEDFWKPLRVLLDSWSDPPQRLFVLSYSVQLTLGRALVFPNFFHFTEATMSLENS